MYDVFYHNKQPNLFPFEKFATSLEEAAELSRTKYFWYIDGRHDYSDFDFWWRPNDDQNMQTHVFPSKWQNHSEVYFRPKTIIGPDVFNYDKNKPVVQVTITVPEFMIIHNLDDDVDVSRKHRTIRFIDSYLGTFKRIINKTKDEYIWITSDRCDYTNFDFSWHPSNWEKTFIHVFPSDEQIFGDTFYIHVPSLREQIKDISKLEYFKHIHYCKDQTVPTHNYPEESITVPISDVVLSDLEFISTNLGATNLNSNKVLFSWSNNQSYNVIAQGVSKFPDNVPKFTPNLWDKSTRKLTAISKSGSILYVPKEFFIHFKTQAYDYPYIEKFDLYEDKPLDIAFISNGEPEAERWYDHLLTLKLPNRIYRILNVAGRSLAYQCAAMDSTTINFFAIFAKLEVDKNFDFNWQPDYLQQSKHYVFHAENPVNGLVYGHMAMIAYNRRLTLETKKPGIDFTLSAPHTVVPLMSGIARYTATPLMAWRTAFREVVKLLWFQTINPTIENKYRLDVWTSKLTNNVINANWSSLGVLDACEYFRTLKGYTLDDIKQKVILTYEWDWLDNYYMTKY